MFELGLSRVAKEGDDVVLARTFAGISGTSVAVALLVLVITVLGTCYAVTMIWNAADVYVTVSGVLLKVTLLPGGSTMPTRFFYFQMSHLF